MACQFCEKKPVITLISGRKLCRNDFIKYFEKKVFKTIFKYKLIEDNDRIAVGVSGGKDSLTLLHLLNKLNSRIKNFETFAILIDEGIKGYRDKTIVNAKKFCKEHNIQLKIYSYKEEFGKTLDQLTKTTDIIPCAMCGVFRRYLLNKKSRELKSTKLATGHNLDDEAQAVLMNQFRNNVQLNARMGPITGVIRNKAFIPRIKPLYFMAEKEVMLYAYLKGFTSSEFIECPHAKFSFRGEIRDLLNEFENKHPGTKYSIINSYIEVLPLLKDKYKFTNSRIKECLKCGEPCSGTVCKACELVEKLIKKNKITIKN
ncbi:TIGR00269 family protein [Candidatus Woesearchaeota archaeon]|nr:TIGR00269 family protein [Candidatus Woesearchaeota archaeon]